MLFDLKNFNGEVFGAYVDTVPHLRRNELLKSGAIVNKPEYANMLKDQTGGHYITIPIKDRIGGKPVNYDGNTDLTSTSRSTFTHGRIVVGRGKGWTERDFSSDITGEDFMPAVTEVAEYWDDVDQDTLLSTLNGVFSMTGGKNAEFVAAHTLDLAKIKAVEATNGENMFGPTTLNTAMQQSLGDNKAKFSMAIMHSVVATHLENLNLLEYLKYTDSNGVQRALPLATLNGRLVLVDDDMPAVTKSDDGTYTAYTTYVFGAGAIEYTDCGAKVPYEMARDAKTKGGETTLWTRQRKVFSPFGISWKTPSIISPEDTDLENGANWEVAKNASGTIPFKSIPIARVITRG